MIVDHISNLGRYGHLFADAGRLAAFFAQNPPGSLAAGQECAVPDTGYTVIPVTMEPKPFAEKRWEGHRRHSDLHLVARGRECLAWIPLQQMKEPAGYAEGPDVEFYHDALPGSRIILEAGYFAIFLPEDIHKPILCGEGCGGVKILLKADA